MVILSPSWRSASRPLERVDIVMLVPSDVVHLVRSLRQDRRAVTALEYAMLIACLALAIVGLVAQAGTAIADKFITLAADLG
jgi:Flp pilus assembly pilin Flp